MTTKTRVVLMSSRVTYAPGNYAELFRLLLAPHDDYEVVGVLLHDNRNLRVLLKGAALWGAWVAPRMGELLVRNWLGSDPKMQDAMRACVPCLCTQTVQGEAALRWLRTLRPDLLVHLRTRVILREAILNLSRWGAVNVHHGLLPEFRGTLCDLRQLTQGLSGGFSLHRMSAAVDRGPLLSTHVVTDAAGCGRRYDRYLEMSAREEYKAVDALLTLLHRQEGFAPTQDFGSAPIAPKNAGCWYRTPTRAELRGWVAQGWKL